MKLSRHAKSERRAARSGGGRRPGLRLEWLEERTLLSGPGDDFPDELPDAAFIALTAEGTGTQAGRIDTAFDADAFRFIPPRTGDLFVRADVEPGSDLFLFLNISDSELNQMSYSATRSGGIPPIRVIGGETYYLQVKNDDDLSIGGYSLDFVANLQDDFRSDINNTNTLTELSDPLTQSGRIDYAGDMDLFGFIAPASGALTIDVAPDEGSDLHRVVTVFVFVQTLIPIASDDPQVTATHLGLSNFHVVEGHGYLVSIRSAAESDTGDYIVSYKLRPDDFGNDIASAEPITSSDPFTQSGAIDYAGDLDYFQFVAPSSGDMAVDAAPDDGSELPCFVTVFDPNNYSIPIASDDPRESPSLPGLSNVHVAAGRNYVVRIRSADDVESGNYVLVLDFTIRPDDFSDDFVSAELVELSTAPTRLWGTIESPGDVDVFRFVAALSGTMTVQQAPAAGNGLIPWLRAFDGAGGPLDAGGGLVTLNVVSGQTYYFMAADASPVTAEQKLGVYTLGFRLSTWESEPNDAIDSAEPVFAGLVTSGSVAPTDVDLFRFEVETTSRLTATVHLLDGRTRVSLLDDQQRVLVQSDGRSLFDPTNLLVQHLVPGTYFLRVEALGGGASTYELTTELVAANAPFANAPMGSSPSVGEFDTPNNLFIKDVNGDGRRDLVTYVQGTYDYQSYQFIGGGVEVLLGLGDGTFGPAVLIDSTGGRSLLDVADVDGDGKNDLVLIDWGEFDEELGDNIGAGMEVFLGTGGGSFRPVPARTEITRLVELTIFPTDRGVPRTGDVNNDGRLDLIVPTHDGFDSETYEYKDYGVLVLLGMADGTFQPSSQFSVAGYFSTLAVGDLDGDGLLDLLVGIDLGDMRVFLGGGDGTFRPYGLLGRSERLPYDFGEDVPVNFIAIADLNGDGRQDVMTLKYDSGEGAVYLGRGDGTFLAPTTYQTQFSGYFIFNCLDLDLGDLNGDGFLDLVISEPGSNNTSPSLQFGAGDGTFRSAIPVAVTARGELGSVTLGDVNGDGVLDLSVSHDGPHDSSGMYSAEPGVDVFLNYGDGLFQSETRNATGSSPTSVTVGDVDRDGWPDLITPNPTSDTVSILPGLGNGRFGPAYQFASGGRSPGSTVLGDFNGDGRPDLAVMNTGFYDWDVEPLKISGSGVSVLLGLGDGIFGPPVLYEAGALPLSVAIGDVDGDGHLDLLVMNALAFDPENPNQIAGVAVLRGRGDGTFRPLTQFTLGGAPTYAEVASLHVIDVDGDHKLDLVALDMGVNDGSGNFIGTAVVVLPGHGDGTFGPSIRSGVEKARQVLTLGDVDGDGLLDAVVFNDSFGSIHASVSVLLGLGNGSFGPPAETALGHITPSWGPNPLGLADVNGDGRLDLLMTAEFWDQGDQSTFGPDSVAVFLNEGHGSFSHPIRIDVGSVFPGSLALADLNEDGRTDLVTANFVSGDTSVRLGLGDGTFLDPSDVAITIQATPHVADFDRDGTNDLLILNNSGEILWRRGQPGSGGLYEPPVVVNPGRPARDLAVVVTDRGPLIAAVDVGKDSVTIYGRNSTKSVVGSVPPGYVPTALAPAGGGFFLEETFGTGPTPARIVAGDLDGDGLLDLAVVNSLDGSIWLFRGEGDGGFQLARSVQAGRGISGLALLMSVSGRALPDLVLTNQVEGDVRMLPNLGGFVFGEMRRYHADAGLYGVRRDAGVMTITTEEPVTGLAVGVFSRGGSPGVAALNLGARSLELLAGLPGGGLANASRVAVTGAPKSIAPADFNGDGLTDLAVLAADGLHIFMADGAGGFLHGTVAQANSNGAGLSTIDVDGDGIVDLLVGNEFGDVLILVGNGDGTFKQFQPRKASIALAVSDLNGDGMDDFVFANSALERVSVEYSTGPVYTGGTKVVRDRSDGLLTPSAIQLADLDGDGVKDLIIANGGGNNMLIYRGLGNGQFGERVGGARGFVVGTNPSGFTVADVNGDGKLDLLVANNGSNDVSVLLGSGSGAGWTMVPGPRLTTGGGPVATLVGDFNNDGKSDLAVANQQAKTIQIFDGRGGGFFNDQSPATYALGQAPFGLFGGNFRGLGPEIGTFSPDGNTVSIINPATQQLQILGSGGLGPSAGFAGDFNGDGFSDLVVGNRGDGAFSLFLGSSGGLSLSQTFTSLAVPSPTSLIFGGLSAGVLSFYASSEGREAAARLSFSLQGGSPVVPLPGGDDDPIFGNPLSPTPEDQPLVETVPRLGGVLSLDSSTLDLIAPLFTISLLPGSLGNLNSGGGVNLLASFLPDLGSIVGQVQLASDEEAEDETTDESGVSEEEDPDEDAMEVSSLPLWARIVVGLDEAWEAARAGVLDDGFETADPVDKPTSPPHRPSLLSGLLERLPKSESELKARLNALVPSAVAATGEGPTSNPALSPESVDAAIEALSADPHWTSESSHTIRAVLAGLGSIATDPLSRTVVVVAAASAAIASWKARKPRRPRASAAASG